MGTSFSVVVPTLARENLARAVASALDQTLDAHEIIVVANGPLGTDAAGMLCSGGIADQRVGVLSLPPRSGPGMSRNVGAWNASGKYVAFLDDDDYWAPDYLEQIDASLAQSEADLLFATKVFIDAAGRPKRTKRPSDVAPSEWIGVLMDGRNPGVGGQNMTVRREWFFDIGGFPVDLTSGQDRHFTITALRSGCHLATVDEAVVYLQDPDGYRATGRPSNWVNDLKILTDNWSAMRWRSRVRHARMVVARTRSTLSQRRHNRRVRVGRAGGRGSG